MPLQELLLPLVGPPGLHGDGAKTLGLLGGDKVTGGDSEPAGTPTLLQCNSGFINHVLGTASEKKKH